MTGYTPGRLGILLALKLNSVNVDWARVPWRLGKFGNLGGWPGLLAACAAGRG